MRWAHCPPNITIRLKSVPYPMMRTVMGFVIAGGGSMVVVEAGTLWRAARISCGNRRLRRSIRWRRHGLLRLARGAVRCYCRWRCTAWSTPIDYLNSRYLYSGRRREELGAIREVFGDNSPAISATSDDLRPLAGCAGVRKYLHLCDAGARF